MSENVGEVSQREWGELGKKVMEFRRRLPAREQAMFDEVLHAAFKGAYGSNDVQGFGMFTGAEVNYDRWPANPPEALTRGR